MDLVEICYEQRAEDPMQCIYKHLSKVYNSDIRNKVMALKVNAEEEKTSGLREENTEMDVSSNSSSIGSGSSLRDEEDVDYQRAFKSFALAAASAPATGIPDDNSFEIEGSEINISSNELQNIEDSKKPVMTLDASGDVDDKKLVESDDAQKTVNEISDSASSAFSTDDERDN